MGKYTSQFARNGVDFRGGVSGEGGSGAVIRSAYFGSRGPRPIKISTTMAAITSTRTPATIPIMLKTRSIPIDNHARHGRVGVPSVWPRWVGCRQAR
jgi:hypothetical protein